MSELPHILAVGALDEMSLRGTGGFDVAWSDLGVRSPGNGRTLKAIFGSTDPTFRRLDRLTRALVLAAKASGIEKLLSRRDLENMALCVETTYGSLEVDLHYARSLADGVVRGAIFPYTLPSTCLGDLALRLGSKGPTLSFSVEPGHEGEALSEARRLIAGGEVRTALVGTVDAMGESRRTGPPLLRAVVALVAAQDVPLSPVAVWPSGPTDPFVALGKACGFGAQRPTTGQSAREGS